MSRTTQEQIEIMQYFANGGEIECTSKDSVLWGTTLTPNWNWAKYDYRIKEKNKTITIEKWLYKHKQSEEFAIKEGCKNWLKDFDIQWIKIKLLKTYEVEL